MPKEQLIWKLDGVSFWADRLMIERTRGIWSSYAINRKTFDKWLADIAVNAGAKLFINAELTVFEIENENNVKKAFIRTPKGEILIEPKVVIAADGVDSTVLKLLDLKSDEKTKCGGVLSFEMENLKIDKPHSFQVFSGEFAPGASMLTFSPNLKIWQMWVLEPFLQKKYRKIL